MNTVILTVAHKDFDDSFLPDGYRVIRVGRKPDTNGEERTWFSDADGENIADENPYYCELTAQYWAWKNLAPETDILGLVHYRRFFMDYHKGSTCFAQDILKRAAIERVLTGGDCDILIPYYSAKLRNSSILYRHRPLKQQDKQWQIVYGIMREYYPEYVPAFEKVIYGKRQCWFNMFIARKETFCAYSEWLFGVLKRYDEVVRDTLHEERIPRVDGFLSELLILVWVEANIDKKRIRHYDVKNTEANELDYGPACKSRIKRFIYRTPSLLGLSKWAQTSLRALRNLR